MPKPTVADRIRRDINSPLIVHDEHMNPYTLPPRFATAQRITWKQPKRHPTAQPHTTLILASKTLPPKRPMTCITIDWTFLVHNEDKATRNRAVVANQLYTYYWIRQDAAIAKWKINDPIPCVEIEGRRVPVAGTGSYSNTEQRIRERMAARKAKLKAEASTKTGLARILAKL